jgi:hypothetical protein
MSKSSVALDNLRAFVILIVLAFHSVLAYLQFLPDSPYRFDMPPYKWQSFAIIDSARFIGFDLFCAYQDVYLMSLMFFLSGLFVWPSLVRKGSWNFLSDRFVRLGLPFALALMLLMPVTLYPTYRVTATDPTIAEYWRQFMALPLWPSGPQWFLWQLLSLNIVAAVLYRLWPRAIQTSGALASALSEHPVKFYLVLVAASIGARLHALGMVPDRPVRLPTGAPAALRRLFLRRRGDRDGRPRTRPALLEWGAGAALGGLVCRLPRLFFALDRLDGANRRHHGGRAPRRAHGRRYQPRLGVRRRLLFHFVAVSAVCYPPLARGGEFERQRLWHVSRSLCIRRLAAIRAARCPAWRRRQGDDRLLRHTGAELGSHCGHSLHPPGFSIGRRAARGRESVIVFEECHSGCSRIERAGSGGVANGY